MNFKNYYLLIEGLIDIPKDYIKTWVDSHIDEIINKIKETYKTGYESSIDDNLVINTKEIPITVVKHIPNSDAYMSVNLKFGDDIYIDATNVVPLMKTKNKFKDFITSSLIHEVTHIFDKGVTKKPANPSSNENYTEYINSSREFPAYANEMIERIKHKSDSEKSQILDALRFNKHIKDKQLQDFVQILNQKNKIKFVNYILQNV